MASEHRTYQIEFHKEDDGSYWAQVVELPGCFASGFSMEELEESLAEAIGLYLSSDMVTVTVALSPVDDDHHTEASLDLELV